MRLESMVAMTGLDIPSEFIRRYISSALNVLIHLTRLSDGSRKLVKFHEITGMEGNIITLQELFSFEQTGIDEEGRVNGVFRMHGIRPRFTERLNAYGIHLPDTIFDPARVYEA
jgi:pilus assembly protein CpaF